MILRLCKYCHKLEHPQGCPNYIQPKSTHYCSVCDEGILNGEEYIVNDDGEYAHLDCIDYARDLVKFLGYEIKEMEEIDDKYNI